jgi:membrane-bound lytic murein transglycosylase B
MRDLLAIGISASIVLSSIPARAQDPPVLPRPSFSQWLAELRAEAVDRGLRPEIVEQALATVEEPLAVVIERDRSQAEIVLPLETYVNRRLTKRAIASGRDMLSKHQALLARVADKYGVPPKIVVAIWGIESNFGQFSGVRPTVAALATLAWDARRAMFFRGELLNALEILSRGDIDVTTMKGSWAGAMGQPQFMPSSYLQFAEDFDGDGQRDIWHSPADVFASIANYLKGHGWTVEARWGREVSIAADAARAIDAQVERRSGSCRAMRDMTVALPLDEWSRLGVHGLGGGALPKGDARAALVSGAARRFLVYDNYDALLSYNCAHAYALSVGLLADRIGGEPAAVPPQGDRAPRKQPAKRSHAKHAQAVTTTAVSASWR